MSRHGLAMPSRIPGELPVWIYCKRMMREKIMKILAIAVLVSFEMVAVAWGQDCPAAVTQPCCVNLDAHCGMSPAAIHCVSLIVQEPTPSHPLELASVVVQEGSPTTPSSVLSSPAPEVAISPNGANGNGPDMRSGSPRVVNNTGMRRRSGLLGRFFYRFR